MESLASMQLKEKQKANQQCLPHTHMILNLTVFVGGLTSKAS